MRPCRLNELLPRQKFAHDRFDIKYWGAIDGVKLANEQLIARNPYDCTNGTANSVGSVLTALREDTNRWPGLVVSRMPCAGDNFVRGHLMK